MLLPHSMIDSCIPLLSSKKLSVGDRPEAAVDQRLLLLAPLLEDRPAEFEARLQSAAGSISCRKHRKEQPWPGRRSIQPSCIMRRRSFASRPRVRSVAAQELALG